MTVEMALQSSLLNKSLGATDARLFPTQPSLTGKCFHVFFWETLELVLFVEIFPFASTAEFLKMRYIFINFMMQNFKRIKSYIVKKSMSPFFQSDNSFP